MHSGACFVMAKSDGTAMIRGLGASSALTAID